MLHTFSTFSHRNFNKLIIRYHVIDTDYESYSISYSCHDGHGLAFDNLWIMSRKPTMDEEEYKRVLKIAKDKIGFDEELEKTTQEGCEQK